MTAVLGLDTSTAATTVALVTADGAVASARHDPAPGARPEHARRLLPLVEAVAGDWDGVERLAVGVGPGTFTGLRIGVATARALAQGRRLPLDGVSSLRALARGVRGAPGGRAILAVLDARRGEAFAAAYDAEARPLDEPAALAPAALAQRARDLRAPVLAVGDGSVRFREPLETAGAVVPPDDSALHRLSARHVCALAIAGETQKGSVLPDYRRLPDAQLHRRE